MGDPDYLCCTDEELLADCEVHTYRASGPGGQKRNKIESAVRLHHRPTGLFVTATESRSQHENKGRALRRLRLSIALHVRRPMDLQTFDPDKLVPGCPSGPSLLHIGRRHRDYPRVVQTVLDVLEGCQGRLRPTAEVLKCSTGRLAGFLKSDPKLWAEANALRKKHGCRPIR